MTDQSDLTPEMQAALKEEITADPMKRGYAGKTLDEQITLLHVEFSVEDIPATTLENQPILWQSIRRSVQATGEWPNIVLRSEMRPADNTVKAALNAVATDDTQIIDPNDEKAWVPFTEGLQLFQAAGDLSADTVKMLLAMITVQIPAVMSMSQARITQVFHQIAGAPNAVTADDLAEALS